MIKTQRNPVVISDVYFLGKGEVACSNHASSTIPIKILFNIFRMLRRSFVYLLSCIFAGLVAFILICFALEMQFMGIHKQTSTQSRHTIEGYSNGKNTHV